VSAIHTFSGRKIDPCAPTSDALSIRDIAHALSLVCRAGGHFPQFYSVCQHSVACAREAAARGWSKRLQLLCLLHDASEAYLSDMTRPVKEQLPQYGDYEARLQALIYETLAGGAPTADEQRLITAADDCMLRAEFLHFMDIDLMPDAGAPQSDVSFNVTPFDEAARAFLELYRFLTLTA
jgi:hypothetical protein